jgi:DNA-nicking Smr family endonuclease
VGSTPENEEAAGNGAADPDVQLFREAVRDVKRLAHGSSGLAHGSSSLGDESSGPAPGSLELAPEHAPTRRRPPRPLARFSRADRQAVLQESLSWEAGDPELAAGDELVYHRPGVQMSVLKKLRRGQYRVQAEIDLHGLTVAEAKQFLREFLADALERQLRCVRIIHGKGLRSGHRGPVLKGVVSSVLRRVAHVVAYVSARQVDGGTGAVYVLLAN